MLRRMMTRMVMLRLPGPAQLKCRAAFQKSHFLRKFTENNAATQIEPRTQTHILCEPAQAKRMSRFHKSHFIRKFRGKMPRPRLSPECRRTFCVSLRSRNPCPHVTRDIRRATLYGNIQEKCRSPEWAPWSSTGLYCGHTVWGINGMRRLLTTPNLSQKPLLISPL